MRKASAVLGVIALSGTLSLPLARAQNTPAALSAAFPDTVQLPQTSTIGAFAGRHFHFRVAAATDRERGGVFTHGIPAWTVSIQNGVGGWDGPTRLPLPKSVLNGPGRLREKIALFQVESGMGGGWIAVPRGWRVVSAVAGAQGTWGITFAAPGGPGGGWIVVGGSGPGTSEVFSAADGYFQGVYQLENEIIPGTLSHDATLSPTPISLLHPNPCTAVISYKSGGLVVKGVEQFGIDGITGFSIALPPREANLRHFLFRAFRTGHHVSQCPRNIKDW